MGATYSREDRGNGGLMSRTKDRVSTLSIRANRRNRKCVETEDSDGHASNESRKHKLPLLSKRPIVLSRKMGGEIMSKVGTCAICLEQTKVQQFDDELLCFSDECRTAWKAFRLQSSSFKDSYMARALLDNTQSQIWLTLRSASVNLDTNNRTNTQFNEYRDNKAEAQVLVDLIQEMVNNDKIWEASDPLLMDLRRRLRLLLVRFWALNCSELVIALEKDITIPNNEITDLSVTEAPLFSFTGLYKGKKVLVKFPRPITRWEPPDIRTQVREIMLLRNLKHGHIIPFLGLYNHPTKNFGGPGIVLPFMPYSHVRHFLEAMDKAKFLESQGLLYNSVITQPRIHRWMLQMADALAYLHREDVVHGDVRGRNFLVDDNLNMCMIDFNMALYASGRPGQNGSTATDMDAWCAPELWQPRAGTMSRSSKPSDVWSLGCVFIELYTGKDPLERLPNHRVHAVTEWTTRILQKGERPPRPLFHNGKAMPDELWNIISKGCWATKTSENFHVDTSERWTAEEVFTALKNLYSYNRSRGV
ncbi:kinase-like domain-containing protein [Abortiporus biennis]|nr:kinase-like domain-containing protein [Abortiporus biennis]